MSGTQRLLCVETKVIDYGSTNLENFFWAKVEHFCTVLAYPMVPPMTLSPHQSPPSKLVLKGHCGGSDAVGMDLRRVDCSISFVHPGNLTI